MPHTMTIKTKRYRPGSIRCSLLQRSGDLLGVLLMPLEDFEAGLQKALEFAISGGWNQCRLKRAIHGRVVRYLIGT